MPRERRKVIVLVGRHPNEGTINIAQRHHRDWEKHGAVVVRIPADWTPHGFWKRVLKTAEAGHDVKAFIVAEREHIPNDSQLFWGKAGLLNPLSIFTGRLVFEIPFSKLQHIQDHHNG